MKIYSMSGACYSEDGDLMSYARAFKDLESAKAALREDFEENARIELSTENEWTLCLSSDCRVTIARQNSS